MVSEVITPACVDVCVVLELTEESVRIVAEEYIRPDFPGEVVVNLVVDVRAHIGVFIRRRIVGEKREAQVLIHEQFRQANRC